MLEFPKLFFTHFQVQRLSVGHALDKVLLLFIRLDKCAHHIRVKSSALVLLPRSKPHGPTCGGTGRLTTAAAGASDAVVVLIVILVEGQQRHSGLKCIGRGFWITVRRRSRTTASGCVPTKRIFHSEAGFIS